MPDENIQAFLLFLSPEEKKKAQDYVAKRLGMLDAESLQSLGCLMAHAKKSMGLVETGRARLKGAPNPYAKVMGRLYDEALVGYAQLLQQCNRAYMAKERELKNIQRAQAASSTGRTEVVPLEEQPLSDDLRVLLLEPTEGEEAAALDYIQKRVQEMEFIDLILFRDVTHRLLTWWESTQGQTEGLMLNQFGEIGSVDGRRMRREKYEDMQRKVLNPFKSWFQNLNTVCLKKRKERGEAVASGGIKKA